MSVVLVLKQNSRLKIAWQITIVVPSLSQTHSHPEYLPRELPQHVPAFRPQSANENYSACRTYTFCVCVYGHMCISMLIHLYNPSFPHELSQTAITTCYLNISRD